MHQPSIKNTAQQQKGARFEIAWRGFGSLGSLELEPRMLLIGILDEDCVPS